MKKFSEWVMALLFSGTLLVLMAATILLPKERYSYYENRNLSAFPEISVESIANGKVFGELETMFCDYAAWRTANTSWIPMLSTSAMKESQLDRSSLPRIKPKILSRQVVSISFHSETVSTSSSVYVTVGYA